MRSVPSLRDLEAVGAAAQKEAQERKNKARGGSGSCIGLPELVPGRFVSLAKLDSALDGSYYIRKVSHAFGADGFTTNFGIRGWT